MSAVEGHIPDDFYAKVGQGPQVTRLLAAHPGLSPEPFPNHPKAPAGALRTG